MSDPNCIFCGIVKNEKTEVISLPDIKPVAPGHTLVIPVAHYHWFYEIPDDLSDKLFREAKKLAKELKAKYEADYIELSIVGKDVPHTHIHLIPRKLG